MRYSYNALVSSSLLWLTLGVLLGAYAPVRAQDTLTTDLGVVTNMVTEEYMSEHPGAYGIPPEGTYTPAAPDDPGEFFADKAAEGVLSPTEANQAGASPLDLARAGAISPDEMRDYMVPVNPLDIQGRVDQELDLAYRSTQLKAQKMASDTAVFLLKLALNNLHLIGVVLVVLVLWHKATHRTPVVRIKGEAPGKARKPGQPEEGRNTQAPPVPPAVGPARGVLDDDSATAPRALDEM